MTAEVSQLMMERLQDTWIEDKEVFVIKMKLNCILDTCFSFSITGLRLKGLLGNELSPYVFTVFNKAGPLLFGTVGEY